MNGRNITLQTLVYNSTKYECGHIKEPVLNYKIEVQNCHRGCVYVVLPISGSVALQSDGIHSDRFQKGLWC
jgi:hypothetical protein